VCVCVVQFFLRFFPNMLPSRFQDQDKRDAMLRRQVQAHMGLAAFLQETVKDM
jgi:hypothetical protein